MSLFESGGGGALIFSPYESRDLASLNNGFKPKRRISQSSARSAIANTLFIPTVVIREGVIREVHQRSYHFAFRFMGNINNLKAHMHAR